MNSEEKVMYESIVELFGLIIKSVTKVLIYGVMYIKLFDIIDTYIRDSTARTAYGA